MLSIKKVIYIFIDKKLSTVRSNKFTGAGVKSENMLNQEFAEELHKAVYRKFEKWKKALSFYRQ